MYYNQDATKYISIYGNNVLDSSWLFVDGNDTYSSQIQLYDDGTNGDDVANNGIFTRNLCSFL